jgi:predicted  nucleic acid-binding Zn-ribbon protein
MRVRGALMAVVGAMCGGLAVAVGAQGTREPDVLSALLTEVRGLRQAMEHMASAGPRVQLALGRLQLQEQRVSGMIRRLESVRESVAGTERRATELQMQIRGLQDELKTAEAGADRDDVLRARAMTYEIGELKRRLEPVQQEIQRWQVEEAALQQQIAGEQARWADINRTLEELERALGRR